MLIFLLFTYKIFSTELVHFVRIRKNDGRKREKKNDNKNVKKKKTTTNQQNTYTHKWIYEKKINLKLLVVSCAKRYEKKGHFM